MKLKLRALSRLALLSSLFLLPGCASGPTQEQLSNADYGSDMTAEECVSIAQQAIANSLKDPSSAQFRNSTCSKGSWNSVPILGMGVAFGWMQQGEVNGKNSYGGYVGFRPYQVLIKNGAVVRYCIANEDGICMPSGH